MNDSVVIDIFAEDRAHEEFLKPLVMRIASEETVHALIRVRSARGGHSRALKEFELYQRLVEKGTVGTTVPDLLVVGIDGNCATFAVKRDAISNSTLEPFMGRVIAACPDPHVERWYLADPPSFHQVVGHQPTVGRRKCERDHYKRLLVKSIRDAGHSPTLGGVEFAPELVAAMDLHRAGRADGSFNAFVGDLRGRLRQMRDEDSSKNSDMRSWTSVPSNQPPQAWWDENDDPFSTDISSENE